MKPTAPRLLVLLLPLAAAVPVRAATIHVSPAGDGTDGASWETACATIEAGVAAAEAGDTVVLDDGTFALAGDLTVSKAVTITSRTGRDASIIDVNGAKEFKFAASGCVLDRVTVVNSGSGNSYKNASGLYVNATGCAVSNCVFRQCGNRLGGMARWSIYADKADTTISGCILTNNAPLVCPGIFIAGGLVENCLVADNHSRLYEPNVPARHYLALQATGAGATTVRNCTIAGNSVPDDRASVAAVRVAEDIAYANRRVVLENNVIRNNTNGSSSPVVNDWEISQKRNSFPYDGHDMSLWKDNCISDAATIAERGGTGNFSDDPLLEADGFSLFPRSPCIGAANTNAPATDVFGRARPSPASVGAVEPVPGDAFRAYVAASATHVVAPGPIRLAVLTTGTAAEPISYAFDLDGDGEPDVTNGTGEAELSEPGVYHVAVTATDAAGRTASAPVPGELVVHGPVVHVRADADAPVRPYATEAAATTNIADAIADCFPGCMVLVHPGKYVLGSVPTVAKAISIVGPAGGAGEATFAKGGFKIEADGAAIRNLVFDQSSGVGGDTRIDASPIAMTADGVVSNCVFRNTTDWNSYPSGQIDVSAGLVTGCIVSNCVSRVIAGIRAAGTAVVENCLVADGLAGERNHYNQKAQNARGGAFNVAGGAIVRNCTVVSNRIAGVADADYGCWASPALHVQPGFAGEVVNCVFAGNARRFEADGAYVATNDVAIGSALLSHCAVEDPLCDYEGYEGMVTNGIAFAEGFAVPVPAPGSALVDAGLGGIVLSSSVDLLGRRRRAGRVDIGCTEAEKPRCTIVIVK